MAADGVVEIAAHGPKARRAVTEGGLGGDKALPGGQGPAEMIGFNAQGQPHAGAGQLRLNAEVPAVNQQRTPAAARRLGGIGGADHGGGVVEVGGDAAHAVDHLHAGAQGGAVGGALSRPLAVKGDEVQVLAAKVQHCGGHTPQGEGSGTGIFHHGSAGDEVAVLHHAVKQPNGQAGSIPQGDLQRIGAGGIAPEGRHPGQGIFAGPDRRAGKAQPGGNGPVGKFRLKEGRVVVGQAGSGPLLGQQVGPAARVRVGRGHTGRSVGAGAVIEMEQTALVIDPHLVGGVGGVQGKIPPGSVAENHGHSS